MDKYWGINLRNN
ncbi:hypothetical protein YPPY66_1052, partial [Yersinia pestis PY-66]